jgi:DNA repair protein RadD
LKQLRDYQIQAVKECWQALKKDDQPVLLMASVGAGKSLMLANILLTMQNADKRALCLVNNAELVRNNSATFVEHGGNSSVYCAALDSKDTTAPVVFGTPQSVLNGILKNENIAQIKFNIIIVDEAHNINFNNHRSCFMRILRHYKNQYADMRVLGATGTNFRFRGNPIVGDDCIFKSQVGNITTEDLIKDKYLIEPKFEVDKSLVIDFSEVKIKQNGQFDQKQLSTVVDKNTRLTELICKQIIHIMNSQKRFGIFIFATTKKHAYEILSHLPSAESAIILGETPQNERSEILEKARCGAIRFIVNIAIISVGVDVPAYDSLAYLRPTESLVLLVQTMGRALRLSDGTGKRDALILDFAGNIARHSDWDNPILLQALKQTEDVDKPLVIKCPKCQEMNKETSRRCIGFHDKHRCDYYFEFKQCPNDKCQAQNDIAARHCHACQTEIIDPNAKLSLIKADLKELEVLEAKFVVSDTQNFFRINCAYYCKDTNGSTRTYYESYIPNSDKAKNFFYGQFVKKHCPAASSWYPHLKDRQQVEIMLQSALIPKSIMLKYADNKYQIKNKIFEVTNVV